MRNSDAESQLRMILAAESEWSVLNAPKKNGETGTDVLAVKDETLYFIEVIGYKSSGPARSKDFFEGFWRTISRLEKAKNVSQAPKHHAIKLVLAVPSNFKLGMEQRHLQYSTAWSRIARAFPELELWYISESNLDRRPWERPI